MASWVEMFHMPMREIEAKFTRSELALIAWRSQESFLAMRKKFPRDRHDSDNPLRLKQPKAEDFGVPKGLLSEKGEMDIRKLTAKDLTGFISDWERRKAEDVED